MPQLTSTQGGLRVGKRIQCHATLLRPESVAPVAVLLENRLDIFSVTRRNHAILGSNSPVEAAATEQADHREPRNPARVERALRQTSESELRNTQLIGDRGDHRLIHRSSGPVESHGE